MTSVYAALSGRQSEKTNAVIAPHTIAAFDTWIRTSHHGSFVRYWISPTIICTASTPSTSSAPRR